MIIKNVSLNDRINDYDTLAVFEEVARAAALPPSLGQSAEPLEPAKDTGHSDSTAGDENKEAKSYTDLSLDASLSYCI
jgi:hypothetical protein